MKIACFADESYNNKTGRLCVAVVCFEYSSQALKAGDEALECIAKAYNWRIKGEMKAREFCKSRKFKGIDGMLNCLKDTFYAVECEETEMSVEAKERLLLKALRSLGIEYSVLIVDAGLLGPKPKIRAKVVNSKKVKGVQVADLLAGCGARGLL